VRNARSRQHHGACVLAERLVEPVMRIENRLAPALGPLMAFRLLMLIAKRS
jgi:hypothetical protein